MYLAFLQHGAMMQPCICGWVLLGWGLCTVGCTGYACTGSATGRVILAITWDSSFRARPQGHGAVMRLLGALCVRG
jgi:hypothetical protein